MSIPESNYTMFPLTCDQVGDLQQGASLSRDQLPDLRG